MKDMPGAANCTALLPGVDGGKMIAVTAEPAWVVPGTPSMSTVAAAPVSASPSGTMVVPPPGGCTLYRICPGVALTKAEKLIVGTVNVAAAGTTPLVGYVRTSTVPVVVFRTRRPTLDPGSGMFSSRNRNFIAPARAEPYMSAVYSLPA